MRMATAAVSLPLGGTIVGFRRFSVSEYHALAQAGVLTEDDRLELIEGYLVLKMTHNPPHDGSISLCEEVIRRHLPSGWLLRIQCVITLSCSEPEPDLVISRGNARTYLRHHPGPTEVGLVIEVSDSSLPIDRTDKCRIYARAGIACYWIVNMIDRQVEVYTSPSGPADAPAYAHRQDYLPGDSVPLVLDGTRVALIPVADCLP
jgi:hypothetical protein